MIRFLSFRRSDIVGVLASFPGGNDTAVRPGESVGAPTALVTGYLDSSLLKPTSTIVETVFDGCRTDPRVAVVVVFRQLS